MIYLQLMTDDEVNTVFHGLAQLPWAKSNDIIHRLNEAVAEKRKADAEATEEYEVEYKRMAKQAVPDESDD